MEARQTMNLEPMPPLLPSTNLARNKIPPIRQLIPNQIKERRKKGLCFNCDENFRTSHRCKKLFLIEGIFLNEEEVEDEVEEERVVDSKQKPVILSTPLWDRHLCKLCRLEEL